VLVKVSKNLISIEETLQRRPHPDCSRTVLAVYRAGLYGRHFLVPSCECRGGTKDS
jgi:hypothetical protein